MQQQQKKHFLPWGDVGGEEEVLTILQSSIQMQLEEINFYMQHFLCLCAVET